MMLFSKFCNYLLKLESISSRLEMTGLLSDLFSELKNNEIRNTMYLLIGRIAPKFDPLEFNLSTKLMIKAFEGIGSKTFFFEEQKNNVGEIFKETGDIGITFEKLFIEKNFTGKNLAINEVFESLKDIAILEGTGSQGVKIEKIQSLFGKLSPLESRFASRMVVGKLRLGASDKTILDALSWVKFRDKSARELLDRAYGVRADIGEVAEIVLSTPKEDIKKELTKLSLKVGVPVASKLVEREKSPEKVFERLQRCLVQPKLDGLRIQLHKWSSSGETRVELFSRNMERMTDMFPELVDTMKKLAVDSIVLDSEVIGYDLKTKEYLPFQQTIQRKRKHGVTEKAISIPVKAMIFDVLYLDGLDLTRKTIEDRKSELEKISDFFDKKNIDMLETVDCKTQEEIGVFFHKCVNKGLEGIIAKAYGTPYEPGTRNFDWIKLKASSLEDMVDTIDAIVMGYYKGEGVRAKYGLGAILIGVYDEEVDEYQTLAKVGTGISDEQFKLIFKTLETLQIPKPKNYIIDKNLEADVYVKPEIVVEVEADQITRSKMHTCAIDETGRGLSLRFPRLLQWNRQDKTSDKADTTLDIEKMFNISKNKKG